MWWKKLFQLKLPKTFDYYFFFANIFMAQNGMKEKKWWHSYIYSFWNQVMQQLMFVKSFLVAHTSHGSTHLCIEWNLIGFSFLRIEIESNFHSCRFSTKIPCYLIITVLNGEIPFIIISYWYRSIKNSNSKFRLIIITIVIILSSGESGKKWKSISFVIVFDSYSILEYPS